MIKNILFVVAVIIIWLAFVYKDKEPKDPYATFESPPPEEFVFPDFGCEGKKKCSEMTSCDEAEFYMSNCPGGSKLDPDGDGVPCEDLCAGKF